jgi:hypothetical protein
MLIAIPGFILLVGCDGSSNNPVQIPASGQNEITSLAKSGNDGPSASGQGSFIFEDGHRRIFAFHAVTHPNGSVTGKGMLTKVSPSPDLRQQFHFDIDCLNVNDNVAIMSGMITRVIRIHPGNPDLVLVGQHIQFKVIDNGEGANADPDEMSYFAHGTPEEVPPCDEYDVNWNRFTIDAGNIQVRP